MVVDFFFECLNPAARRMLRMPEQLTPTHNEQWPHSVKHGTFAFHMEAFVSGAPCAFDFQLLVVQFYQSSFQIRVQKLMHFFRTKAYSIDLRERVVAACGEPRAWIYQVAARFRVSIAFVDN